jgi:hypothetical protein
VVAFDEAVLHADPGAMFPPPAGAEAAGGDPNAPACQAALSAFRIAVMFRIIFTGIVAVLAGLTLIALGYVIYRILQGWDATATVTALGGAVTGVAAGFLNKNMQRAINVQGQALADVDTYCGVATQQQLQ